MSLRGELWHHCKASILQYTHTYTHVHIHHLFIKTVVPPPLQNKLQTISRVWGRKFHPCIQTTPTVNRVNDDATAGCCYGGRPRGSLYLDGQGGGGGRRKCQNTDLWDSFGIWCEVFLYFLMLKMALEQLKKKKEGEVFLQHRGKGKRSAGEVETKTV